MKSGIQLVTEERDRQRGPNFQFDEAHDDAHTNGELVDLAEHLIDEADPAQPQQYARNLIKAAATLAAEVDRVVRSTGGTLVLSQSNVGIAQGGAGDPDNRDGSQANAQANDPVRAPFGRDDNKTGEQAGGNKPVVGDTDAAAQTRTATPASTQRPANPEPARTEAATKRAKATSKAKAKPARGKR